MPNENEERAFLEAQLEWVRERDAVLAQIEKRLYEMKEIAELVATGNGMLAEHKRHRLNERFLQLQRELADLERELQILCN